MFAQLTFGIFVLAAYVGLKVIRRLSLLMPRGTQRVSRPNGYGEILC